jgi:hypothetical protein
MKEVFMFLTLQGENFDLPVRENEFDCSFWRVYNDDNEELLILPFGELMFT